MNKFKLFLTLVVLTNVACICLAETAPYEGGVKKTIEYTNIKPTAFSQRLKTTPAYSSKRYGSASYSSGIDGSTDIMGDAILNGMMNGYVNAMTQGAVADPYSVQMLNRQQIEYAQQQAQYVNEMDREPEKDEQTEDKGFWNNIINSF